jgi:anti-sigma B factor antagonist
VGTLATTPPHTEPGAGEVTVAQEPVTTVVRADDTVTVALHGEVDVLTVDQVRRTLTDALAERPKAVVVDLTRLTFIDSTGLGALVFGFQRARDADVAFRLAHPSPAVHQILVLSGLLEVVGLVA